MVILVGSFVVILADWSAFVVGTFVIEVGLLVILFLVVFFFWLVSWLVGWLFSWLAGWFGSFVGYIGSLFWLDILVGYFLV